MSISHKIIFDSKVIFFLILFVICLLAFFLQLDRVNLKNINSELRGSLTSFINDMNNRADFEGKYFYKFSTIEDSSLELILNDKYHILIYLDSIECYSCLEFQLDHINQLSANGITSLIYSNSNSHLILLRKSLINYIDLSAYIPTPNISSGNDIITALVNNKGKIIYADVADKTNYEKSRKFYIKIKKFLLTN